MVFKCSSLKEPQLNGSSKLFLPKVVFKQQQQRGTLTNIILV